MPRTLLSVRAKYYTLLAATLSGSEILRTTAEEMARLQPHLAEIIWHVASVYDVMVHKCNKEIFPLEAFAARFMAILDGNAKAQAAAGAQQAGAQQAS
jgi:hypothetical protein